MIDKQAAVSAEKKPRFNTTRVYIKEASVRSVQPQFIFKEKQEYAVKFELAVNFQEITTAVHEVVLKLTVNASPKEGDESDVVYTAITEQVGRFIIEGFDEEQSADIKNTVCPEILFPFARENIVSQVIKAGFPALYLEPINFNAVNAQRNMQDHKENVIAH